MSIPVTIENRPLRAPLEAVADQAFAVTVARVDENDAPVAWDATQLEAVVLRFPRRGDLAEVELFTLTVEQGAESNEVDLSATVEQVAMLVGATDARWYLRDTDAEVVLFDGPARVVSRGAAGVTSLADGSVFTVRFGSTSGGGSGPSLSNATPAAPAASGSAGVASTAARGDHAHRRQTAAETPFTATTSADWTSAPTTAGGALDQLADRDRDRLRTTIAPSDGTTTAVTVGADGRLSTDLIFIPESTGPGGGGEDDRAILHLPLGDTVGAGRILWYVCPVNHLGATVKRYAKVLEHPAAIGDFADMLGALTYPFTVTNNVSVWSWAGVTNTVTLNGTFADATELGAALIGQFDDPDLTIEAAGYTPPQQPATTWSTAVTLGRLGEIEVVSSSNGDPLGLLDLTTVAASSTTELVAGVDGWGVGDAETHINRDAVVPHFGAFVTVADVNGIVDWWWLSYNHDRAESIGFASLLTYFAGVVNVQQALDKLATFTPASGSALAAASVTNLGEALTALNTIVTNMLAAPSIPTSAMDAVGDLIVGTGPDSYTRKAVGTNGQVLTADSTQTGGVKWADATGGVPTSRTIAGVDLVDDVTAAELRTALAQGFQVLADTNLASAAAAVSASWTGDYDYLVIVGMGRTTATGSSTMTTTVQFNSDTGSNYYNTAGSGSTSLTIGVIAGSQTNTDRAGIFRAEVSNIASARHVLMGSYVAANSASNASSTGTTAGTWASTSRITSVQLAVGGNNFAAGFRLIVLGRATA